MFPCLKCVSCVGQGAEGGAGQGPGGGHSGGGTTVDGEQVDPVLGWVGWVGWVSGLHGPAFLRFWCQEPRWKLEACLDWRKYG